MLSSLPTIYKSPARYQVHPQSPPPPLNITTIQQQPTLPTTMQVSSMLCTSLVIHVRTSMWQEIMWLINKPCGRRKLKQSKPQPSHNQALWLINIRLKKRQPQLRATTSKKPSQSLLSKPQTTMYSQNHNHKNRYSHRKYVYLATHPTSPGHKTKSKQKCTTTAFSL